MSLTIKTTTSSTKRLRQLIKPHPPEYDGYPFLTLVTYKEGNHKIGVLWTVSTDKDKPAIKHKFLDLTNVNDNHLMDLLVKWEQDIPLDVYIAITYPEFNMEGKITTLDPTNSSTRFTTKVVALRGVFIEILLPAIKISRKRTMSPKTYNEKRVQAKKPIKLFTQEVYNFECC